MKIENNDFVNVDFDIYANDKLVQTTNEKLGKEANFENAKYGPQTLIVGKGFILKAMDEDMKKNSENTLELKPEEAYGKRQKELIKTFPKSAFDEQKMRVVVGMTYDFNGMYGTVKSLVGGRVMVDFNNPLSGKEIKLTYKIVKKVDVITEKIKVVLGTILKLPNNMYEISKKEKEVTVKVPAQLFAMKDMLMKSFEEVISDIKDYSVKIEEMKIK